MNFYLLILAPVMRMVHLEKSKCKRDTYGLQ